MQKSVITIQTLECDICEKTDSVMMRQEDIKSRSEATDMGIGAYLIKHNDHTRIIYFDEEGVYLGDTIAMNRDDIPDILHPQSLPFYLKNKVKTTTFRKLRKKVFSILHSKNLTISIAGPSRAGKTTLVRYLDTLIPERDTQLVSSVPTMGKSKKYIKIGKTKVTSLDLGGQEDFWDLWEPAIDEADLVIFLLDGTSKDLLEVARAFETVMDYKPENVPMLVIVNKKDLYLRGHSDSFIKSGEFLSLTNLKLPIPNVLSIEASVFEGKAYETKEFEENVLVEMISSFISDHS